MIVTIIISDLSKIFVIFVVFFTVVNIAVNPKLSVFRSKIVKIYSQKKSKTKYP